MNPAIVALVAQRGAIAEETFQTELSALTSGYHADIARVHILWAEGMIDAHEFAFRHDSIMSELRVNAIGAAPKVAPIAAFARCLSRSEAREAEDQLRRDAIERTKSHHATLAAERVAMGGIIAPTAKGGAQGALTRGLGIKGGLTPSGVQKPHLAPLAARQSPILEPSTPELIAARNAKSESEVKDSFIQGVITLTEAREQIKAIRAFTADAAIPCKYCGGDVMLRRVCQPCGGRGKLVPTPQDVQSPMLDIRPDVMFAFTVSFDDGNRETYDAASGHEAVRRACRMMVASVGMQRARLESGCVLTLREIDPKGNAKTSRVFFEKAKDADKALDKALSSDGWKRTIPMIHPVCQGKGCDSCKGGRTFMSVIHKIESEENGWISDTIHKSELRYESRTPERDQPVASRYKSQWINRGAAQNAAISDRKHVEKINSENGKVNYTAKGGGVIMRSGFVPESPDAIKYRWNATKATRKA